MGSGSECSFKEAVDLICKADAASLEKALEMLLEIKDDDIGLNVHRRLGIIYLETMNYDKAFEEFSKVISDLEKGLNFKPFIDKEHRINDIPVRDKDKYITLLKAWTHHDLAVVLTCKKEYLTAEGHLDKAIDLVKELNDESTEAWFQNDLGWLFHEKCEYPKSIEQYKKVLKLNVKSLYTAYPYFFLGLASYRNDFKSNARGYFKKSKEIIEKELKSLGAADLITYELLIAHILVDIARIDLDEKKSDDAKKNLDLALNIYEKYKCQMINTYSPRKKTVENENIAIAYLLMGRCYFDQDRMDDANRYFEKAESKSESISNKAKYHNNAGCIYLKKGELNKASDSFLSALAKNPSSKEAIENLKIINASKEKAVDLFTFWFDLSQRTLKGLIKLMLAGFLILVIVLNTLLIMAPSIAINLPVVGPISEIYNNESTTEFNYNYTMDTNTAKPIENPTTKKVTEKRNLNIEQRLILIGLCLLILLLPWIKSFSAGTVKIELKETTPLIVTGGAGTSPGSPQIQT
jgi:tetratricopeptide (TPR) repeat protein